MTNSLDSEVTVSTKIAGAPSPSTRAYAMCLLMLIYLVSVLDRQIITILAEPIKLELGVSDTQIGLLSGLAFGLLYCGLGLPLAWLADRVNRVWIISGSLVVWSTFTILCGRAAGFWDLLAARVGVGVGEAGATPTSHALVSDYAPREKRASALAFVSIGAPLGAFAGITGGAFIADAYGWRTAFLIAGLPGLALAALAFFTLKQPPRRDAGGQPTAASLPDAIRYLLGKKTFVRTSAAAAIGAAIAYGHAPFMASFFLRVHGGEIEVFAASLGLQPMSFIGLVYGSIVGVFVSASIWIGGLIADRTAKRDWKSYCIVPAVAAILAAPLLILALSVESTALAFVLLVPANLVAALGYGPVYATAQGLAPPHMRAMSASILMFIVNFVGLGFGALVVGGASDFFNVGLGFGPAEGVRWALIATGSLSLVSGAIYWSSRKHIGREMLP